MSASDSAECFSNKRSQPESSFRPPLRSNPLEAFRKSHKEAKRYRFTKSSERQDGEKPFSCFFRPAFGSQCIINGVRGLRAASWMGRVSLLTFLRRKITVATSPKQRRNLIKTLAFVCPSQLLYCRGDAVRGGLRCVSCSCCISAASLVLKYCNFKEFNTCIICFCWIRLPH